MQSWCMGRNMAIKWAKLNELAAHSELGAPFPCNLPDVVACDFDDLKNQCCIHRVGMLCSVDTILLGKDGRIYFIEFKDSSKNPIASLKKKAFDSLSVFWMTIGRTESIKSICRRAVFMYVTPDSESAKLPSEEFAELLQQDVGSFQLPRSSNGRLINNWLNDFKLSGLYSEIIICTASEFSSNFDSKFEHGEDVCFSCPDSRCGSQDVNIIGESVGLAEESLNKLLRDARLEFVYNGPDFCCDDVKAINFVAAAERLLSNRMYMPSDSLAERRKDMIHVATAWSSDVLYLYHNWVRCKTPLARLVNCIFDSSYIAAWIFSPNKTFDQVASQLESVVAYDGEFDHLERSDNVVWLQNFYDNYIKWFTGEKKNCICPDVKYGLGCFISDGLYRKITTTNVLPIVV